jgi:hypothetical protein
VRARVGYSPLTMRSNSPERTQLISSCVRFTGIGWLTPRSISRRVRRSKPPPFSVYSRPWRINTSRSSCSTIAPADRHINVRHTVSGSRVTSAAARSALSSVARSHSISAVRIGASGSISREVRPSNTRM